MAFVKVVKHRFEGYVTDCPNKEIWARVVDSAKPDCSEELIELRGSILPTKQRRAIKRGTEFDIEIGYLYGPKHFKSEFFKMNLHKPVLWTQAEIDECKRKGAELAKLFQVGDE